MKGNNPFYRYTVTLFLAILSVTSGWAQDSEQESIFFAAAPKYEVRAVWLTTIGGLDWPHHYAQTPTSISRQQKELTDILDKLKAANINTVLLQTRIRGTVIYPSQYEPWDGCLSGNPGTSPGYDALQFAIDECHKRGMELHAWVVSIPVGKWNKLGCTSLRRRYPRLIRKIGDEGYMNPESEETADYIAKICGEIADNYDVDGIHLDYIRYPETWKIKVSQEVGRSHITSIVEKVNRAVKAHKPWIKMSCSPIGKYNDLPRYWSHGWNAYATVCQDAQGWLCNGLMDELFPMMYFQGNQFFPFAKDWQENSYGRIICPGLGVYFLSPQEKDWDVSVIQQEMNVLRQFGLGHAYFRSKFFTDNVKDIYNITCKYIDKYPALIPPMTWVNNQKPAAPTALKVNRTDDGDELSWSGAYAHQHSSRNDYLLYNVYASAEYPVDIQDGRNLIATRLQQPQLTLDREAEGSKLYYAITAVDRYGNESEPTYSDNLKISPISSKLPLLRNDGNTLYLPSKGKILDADVIIIRDMAGKEVANRLYGKTANISSLTEGMYTVYSLGRKNVQHRLGYFMKRLKKEEQ
jgi:uncharacterized lipoprotein YddW (UPF0748 family)